MIIVYGLSQTGWMMLIYLHLMEVLEVKIYIRKSISIILLSLGLCACSSNKISGNMQEEQKVSTEASPQIFLGENITQENNKTEWNNSGDGQVHFLNNKATLFGEYLCINSMYTNFIFSEKDENGNYYSRQFPDDLLSGVMRTYRHFKYND